MTDGSSWAAWPSLGLAATGRSLVRHLSAEYGAPEAGDGGARLRLHGAGRADRRTWAVDGGHKGTRWQLTVTEPDPGPVDAWIRVRGPFGMPLLQSQVIEPLLGAVTAGERVLIPAAAMRREDTVELVVGDAGAGKTTLSMRAVGAGWQLIGDDRVLLGADGVSGFPRRHRVYPDAVVTAPGFVARLRPRDRRALRLRSAVRAMSGGFVRLPALVRPVAHRATGTFRVTRATLLVRGEAPAGWSDDPLALAMRLGTIIDRDRRALVGLGGPWPAALAAARATALRVAAASLSGVPVRLVVSRDAADRAGIDDVAAAFGITR